ncbi:uncharacterized protein LOC143153406 [Ptiloglossa arizonensis]|uniref:uncharacterized protein LOC143153406 n=1 Tax=Ptiloglossa arizonensis TaxID=3350558 RepID=UPI003FA068F6
MVNDLDSQGLRCRAVSQYYPTSREPMELGNNRTHQRRASIYPILSRLRNCYSSVVNYQQYSLVSRRFIRMYTTLSTLSPQCNQLEDNRNAYRRIVDRLEISSTLKRGEASCSLGKKYSSSRMKGLLLITLLSVALEHAHSQPISKDAKFDFPFKLPPLPPPPPPPPSPYIPPLPPCVQCMIPPTKPPAAPAIINPPVRPCPPDHREDPSGVCRAIMNV